ncbi:tripartite tricarboxylate transporter substrate binding protein [Alcaligenaceae bacterium]|nr:tripartite tricarboxylate transporter substrate binding protein [Alcaligenaceae bacterium]
MISTHTRHISARLLGAALAIAAVPLSAPALASDYPNKPITIVVPFAPGGNVDLTARALGHVMSAKLGQTIVVENRSGAGGTIGSAYVARAEADGYTLMVGSTATNATAPALVKTSYHPVDSFTILGGITTTPSVIVVPVASTVGNYKELLAAGAASGDGLNMGSPGTGSLNHLTTEVLKQKTGLNATHIPYKGSGPALSDLMGSQLDALVDQLSSSISLIQSGKLRAIAQTGTSRSPLLPDVPTMDEQGIKDINIAVYTALFAPRGIPGDVETKLVNALHEALKDPELQQRFEQQGSEVIDAGQAEFAAYVADEAGLWGSVIREIGLEAQ